MSTKDVELTGSVPDDADEAEPGAGEPADGARGYEFTDQQNEAFSRLVGVMQFTAAAQLLVAVLLFISFVPMLVRALHPGTVIALLAAVIPLLTGIWTLKAAGHLRQIVTTEGSDIDHLMDAIREFTKLFALQVVAFVIALVLLVALAMLVMTNWPSGPSGATMW